MKNRESQQTRSTGKVFIILFISIVAVSLWPRLYNISSPIMVFHSWRQTDTAAITRNIYRSGMNVFQPRVDYKGNEPSEVECEFQIYGGITALVYHFTGVSETAGRVVSVLFYVLTTIPLGWLGYRLWGKEGALWTVILFAASPLSVIMSRSFQPDSTMLFFLISSVALFWYYLEQTTKKYENILLALTGSALAIAILSKLVALYIGFTFLALVLFYRGAQGLKQRDIWSVVIAGLVPSALWYSYASTFPISFNIWKLGPQNLTNWTGWMNESFFKAFRSHFAGLSLTETTFFLALIGIVGTLAFEKRERRIIPLAWLFGALLYQVLTSRHFTTHSYYYYPVLPIYFLTAAWLPAMVSKQYKLKGIIVVLIILCPLIFTRSYELLYPAMYTIGDQPARMLKLAEHIKTVTSPDDLVITSIGHGLPEVLYYADRRGWNIAIDKATIGRLNNYKKKGARYFGWLQPNLRGFRPNTKSMITLEPLVHVVLSENLPVNYCIGDGYGYYMLIDLSRKFSKDLTDEDNICRKISDLVHSTVRTGNNVEVTCKLTGIDCFILPWPDMVNNRYRITDYLQQSDDFKLIHFTDHGVMFAKNGKDHAGLKGYSFLDPFSTNGNFCKEKTLTKELLPKVLEEAQRATQREPNSFRAAVAYGALLNTAKQPGRAAMVFNKPFFLKNYPLQSRANYLLCAIELKDMPTVKRLVQEILEKWPDNELALTVKKKFKINI